MQKNRIHDGEDSGVESKAERERKHRNGTESAIFDEHTSAEANIAHKIVEPAIYPCAAAVVFGESGITESAIGGIARFDRIHPVFHVVLRLESKVQANFVVEFAINLSGAKDAAKFGESASEAHGNSLER